MSSNPIDTNHLVEKTLSIIPLMSKKLFRPVHILHGSDLNHTHFHILHIIEEAVTIRTTDIAKKLAIRKSNVTPLLNKLIEHNLIDRSRSEEDRRVIEIRLTEDGILFLRDIKAMLQEEVKEKLAQLSTEDQQVLQQAVGDLERVLGKLGSQQP